MRGVRGLIYYTEYFDIHLLLPQRSIQKFLDKKWIYFLLQIIDKFVLHSYNAQIALLSTVWIQFDWPRHLFPLKREKVQMMLKNGFNFELFLTVVQVVDIFASATLWIYLSCH